MAMFAMAAGAGCGDGASKAQASGGESQGEAITAVGCPAQTTPQCVTIMAGGKAYDITEAGVDLSRGVGVSLRGMAAGEVTPCGPKLTNVKVEYQTLKCGPPPAPAAG
ncbi:hypothetical protein [Phenylobacterium deserti]|nr:hypothetical protein [Phenylobacterium deserti]